MLGKGQDKKPSLVFSCSGRMHLAQVGNDIAVTLQNDRAATMGCIAGIASRIDSHLEEAQQGHLVIAIDACKCHCVKKCLNEKNIEIDKHFDLSKINDELQKSETGNKIINKEVTLANAMQIMRIVYDRLGLQKR
ncbi:MAG: putative zinc-binding protein [Cellvibrionaceae bacterium]